MSEDARRIEVAPLTLETFGAFEQLFEAASSPCGCRYWHFEGNKNAWLDRCAHAPAENFLEQRAALAAGHPSAEGLLARDASAPEDAAALGWLKLTARAAVPKLRALPVYRGLDLGPEETSWIVGCFLVHPAARGRGVARALLAAAEAHARARGARALEGFPRRSAEPIHDEEVWQGPERLFVEAGFEVVHDVPPYPVYRKVL